MGVGSSQREALVEVIVEKPEYIDPSMLLFARLHSAADGSSKYTAWGEPQTLGLLVDDVITVSLFHAESEQDFDSLSCKEFAEVYLPWVDIGQFVTEKLASIYELGIKREDPWLGSTARPAQYGFAFARAYNRARNNPAKPRLKVGIRLVPRHCWNQVQSPLDELALISEALGSARGFWNPSKESAVSVISSPAVTSSTSAVTPEVTPEEERHITMLQTHNEEQLGLQAFKDGPAVDDQVQEHLEATRCEVSENDALRAEMQATGKELAILDASMSKEQQMALREDAAHGISASSGDSLQRGDADLRRIATEVFRETKRVTKENIELTIQYEQKIKALQTELMTARQAQASAQISCSSSPDAHFQRAAFQLQRKEEELEALEGECQRLGDAIAQETNCHQEEHVATVQELMMENEVQSEEINRLQLMLHKQRAPAPPMTGQLQDQLSALEAELQQSQQCCAQQQQAAEQYAERLRRETLELQNQVEAVHNDKEVAAAEVELQAAEVELQQATAGTALVVEHEISRRENLDNELSRLMHKIEVFDEKIRKLNENGADIRERASQFLSSVPECIGGHDPDLLRVEELELVLKEQQSQMEMLRRDEARLEDEREKAVKALEARKAESGALLSVRANQAAKGVQLPGELFNGIAPLTPQSPNKSSASVNLEGDDAHLRVHGTRRADHACETQLSDRSGHSEQTLEIPVQQSVSQRAQAYEAACRAKVAQSKNSEPVPRRLLATTKTQPLSPTSRPLQRPVRTLSAVTEQHVLKTGIVCLCRALVDGHDVSVIDLPKCASGAPKVKQGAAFLHRLLNDEVELKSCMESDVCAAQADVKYLRVEQLLRIRERTLDLATESQSHSARNSFLETTDKYLFSALTSRCLHGDTPRAARIEPMHQLGLRIALTVGAVDLLKQGWGLRSTVVERPQLPSYWAIRLKPEEWPEQFGCALLHIDELQVYTLASDVAAVVSGNPVAAVRDRTSGVGKDRMLHWEVLRLVCKEGEDFMTVLDRETIPEQRSSLVDELSAKMLQRATRTVA